MKLFKLMIILMSVAVCSATGQSIRKPWRELTSSERTAYVNAVNSLVSNGTWQQYVSDHLGVHNGGFAQHGSDLFLPWHRYFLYYMEQEMGVSLVYWDWEYNQNGLTEWAASSPMFDNTSGGNNGLFGRNLNSSIANSLGRALNFASPPSGVVAGYLTQTNFTSFRSALEFGLHGDGHCQIGGIMCNINASPTDPVFYLHHSMVDKVYQEWVDLHWSGSNLFSTTPIGTVTGQPSVNPNNDIDSRDLKVWYAGDHLLELNDYTTSGTETYTYTTGTIEAGDFTVPGSTSCTFTADNSYSIRLKTGFKANVGSSFHADISDVAGNGRVAGDPVAGDHWTNDKEELMTERKLDIMNIYPNPSAGSFRVKLPQGVLEVFDYERDYLGIEKDVEESRGTIAIYDASGRMLVSRHVTERDVPHLDFSMDDKGVYIVKLNTRTGTTYSSEVIIQ